MENRDTPAAPVQHYKGLTKRELLAGQILAGLLPKNPILKFRKIRAQQAVEFTDALFDELEKLEKLEKKVLCRVLQKAFDQAPKGSAFVECKYTYNNDRDDQHYYTATVKLSTEINTRNEMIYDIESRSNFNSWI